MATLPVIDVTDTHLAILDIRAFQNTPAFTALMDWCRLHGIDPDTIPAHEPIVRDPDTQTVTHHRYSKVDGRKVIGDDGFVVEPIVLPVDSVAPWPDEVLALKTAGTSHPDDLQAALAEVAHLERQIDAVLKRFGQDMRQQAKARDRLERADDIATADRMDQGRWAFYESARLLCTYTDRKFEDWLNANGYEDTRRGAWKEEGR